MSSVKEELKHKVKFIHFVILPDFSNNRILVPSSQDKYFIEIKVIPRLAWQYSKNHGNIISTRVMTKD